MILDNLHYFNISKNNPEPFLDEFYTFIEINSELDKYIENANLIKNILITIKTLSENSENSDLIQKYYLKLSDNINKYSNATEFSCFINACDNSIESVKEDIDTLKIVVEKFFQNRVLNEFTPKDWIQALIDNNSSRKKGKAGEKKLSFILNDYGYEKYNNLNELNKSKFGFLEFSSKINLEMVRKEFNLKIQTKTQNKNLDLIIKSNEKLFICEAKHINTSGGGQDKQMSELIELLSIKESNKDFYIISFLDGKYSNRLLDDNSFGEKISTQRNEIINYLKNNKNNFWLNTKGFRSLFEKL